MAWQAIDFQGIVSLSRSVVEQLQAYLEDMEYHFSHEIASALVTQSEGSSFETTGAYSYKNKLSEGVELFARKAAAAVQGKSALEPWQNVAQTINNAAWEYVEILESTVMELFQQLDQVSIEQWRAELVQTVEAIKELLTHDMDDLKWSLKRLESHLQEYRQACDNKGNGDGWWQKLRFWDGIIDTTLTKNIEKSQKFLTFNYQKFLQRYGQYEILNGEIEQSLLKFLGYHVLSSLEPEEQEHYRKIYRLLKLWERNLKVKALPQAEMTTVLRMAMSPSHVYQLFRQYYKALKQKLFEQSRQLKNGSLDEGIKKVELQSNIAIQRLELHTLGDTIDKYRRFILKTNPESNGNSKKVSADWTPGEKPPENSAFVEQENEIEMLDRLYLEIDQSLQHAGEEQLNIEQLKNDILRNLHEMGQPLASHAMMAVRAERFVHQLQKLNELGTQDIEIVEIVTQMLSKAMRADWKYHTLHNIPLFHQLYAIHMGIVGTIDDRQHINRWNKFNQLTRQLLQWVKNKKIISHLHEIEIDMTDIKGYLQDFLAYVQRIAKDPNLTSSLGSKQAIHSIALQLLEYRYLFGQFFHFLRAEDSDEKLMRKRFLFVDQYFESVENKLAEIKSHHLQAEQEPS